MHGIKKDFLRERRIFSQRIRENDKIKTDREILPGSVLFPPGYLRIFSVLLFISAGISAIIIRISFLRSDPEKRKYFKIFRYFLRGGNNGNLY